MATVEELKGFKPSDATCPECGEGLVEKEEDGDTVYRCLDCDAEFDATDLDDEDEEAEEPDENDEDDDDLEDDDEDDELEWDCSPFDTREERGGKH